MLVNNNNNPLKIYNYNKIIIIIIIYILNICNFKCENPQKIYSVPLQVW